MDFYDLFMAKKGGFSLARIFHVKKKSSPKKHPGAKSHVRHPHLTPRALARRFSLRFVANFLIFYSLYMIGIVFYQPVKAELRYQYDSFIGKSYVVAEPADVKIATGSATPAAEKGALGRALSDKNIEALTPVDPEFSIIIPKLGANARVIKNVNSADSRSYMDALRTGVAHAAGTNFPGSGRHIYLFAHSTNSLANVGRYNAIFYLLYKLEQGDEVDLFYNGQRFRYTVTGKTIVQPTDVSYLTRQTPKEELTLQTCWPPGTIAERMLIFAKPSSEVK